MASRYGKVKRSFLERAVLGHLGARNRAVVSGPGVGLDNAAIKMGKGKVLIVTTDPVSIVPPLGMETSAWMSVHLIASDYATSANKPQLATFDFNIPREISDDEAERYLRSIDSECRRLGVSIVAGNTGRYPGAGLTVIGGGTMMGTVDEGGYLLSSMARTGDDVVMTKGAAIEATAALATAFREHVEEAVGRRLASKARAYARLCSVVDDALAASSVGIREEGVSAMHDATEGGVLGGLGELAIASGKDVLVDADKIYVSEETRAVCSAFGIDPLVSLSEGTLLAACRRDRTGELLRKLKRNGLRGMVIGSVGATGGRLLSAGHGKRLRQVKTREDPYWSAYASGLRRALR